MMTADEYVARVLDEMPPGLPTRTQIATELRAHIDERLADGHTLDDVLRQLGDPIALADSYLAAERLVAAPLLDRAIAKLVDALVVLVIVVPLAWLTARSVPPGFFVNTIVLIVAFCGSFFLGVYTAIAEYTSGRTVGKRLRRMRVVRESGRRIGLGQSVVRQLPILLSFYWVDALFILFTDRSQRAFELLSKTRVIRASM